MNIEQDDFDKTVFEFAKAVAAYYAPNINDKHHDLTMHHAKGFAIAWYEDEDKRELGIERLCGEKAVSQDDFDKTVFEFAKSLLPSLNKSKGNPASSETIGTGYYKQLLTNARELAIAWYQDTVSRDTEWKNLQNN